MTDWKAIVYAARRAETGVTPLGIQILRANALPRYTVDEDGRIIDPDTNALVTDKETIKDITRVAEKQMEVTSKTGEELLRSKI